MTNYPAPEDNWPKLTSQYEGSFYGYTIEARFAYDTPLVIGDTAFDLRWSKIKIDQLPPEVGHLGVPGDNELAQFNLLTFEQAQALRWWFVASVKAQHRMAFCLETRLVKHRISVSHKVEAVEAIMVEDKHR